MAGKRLVRYRQLANVAKSDVQLAEKREKNRLKSRDYYRKNKAELCKLRSERRKANRLKHLLESIESRCRHKSHISYRWYGGKGIKSFLTLQDLEYLWQRDSGPSMLRPSIDRIDPFGHYTRENCRFIELSENLKRSWQQKRTVRINGKVLLYAPKSLQQEVSHG